MEFFCCTIMIILASSMWISKSFKRMARKCHHIRGFLRSWRQRSSIFFGHFQMLYTKFRPILMQNWEPWLDEFFNSKTASFLSTKYWKSCQKLGRCQQQWRIYYWLFATFYWKLNFWEWIKNSRNLVTNSIIIHRENYLSTWCTVRKSHQMLKRRSFLLL